MKTKGRRKSGNIQYASAVQPGYGSAGSLAKLGKASRQGMTQLVRPKAKTGSRTTAASKTNRLPRVKNINPFAKKKR